MNKWENEKYIVNTVEGKLRAYIKLHDGKTREISTFSQGAVGDLMEIISILLSKEDIKKNTLGNRAVGLVHKENPPLNKL